ncbi:hydroxymethylpyrimidine kinase /phosphomethylpyrimidine kinase [Tepidamorphus gemmatus]|jgi:hydroxymethylpyrimidine/phosphomethylpyrimidine kinase|uniref:hydroxymethylpyrimidine kinase n=1 Tax=Tepidamorphus gemmatus TaxID=747076 RepID=A0A4R3M533_9HYPH|nr:bifunctional hydroxymethylpyrimidine kinase/phosphomethylpyrimidine kinase [Tepidamorphus gemmatus]TCT08390.1 hydroxymethylpyrimidine kinase /phosphomethylpyrimidine kinase [Tepidamorphus gemmatus]
MKQVRPDSFTADPARGGRAPVALSIAGTDPTAGAGMQADLKTFSALGVYGATVITALVAQNTTGVQAVLDIAPDFVAKQIDSVFDDLSVDAVKVGMLSVPAVIETVAERLAAHRAPNIVIDPVMVAKSGDPLLRPEAVAVLRDTLLPLALVITPNLPEAARLLDADVADSEAAMRRQGERLLALGPKAVLMKGGHAEGDRSVDILVSDRDCLRFEAPRVATRNTHGTGCTLSAAIAAGLAKGLGLEAAVRAAKDYLTAALVAADTLGVGHGHGPVHHFHSVWS